MTHLEQLLEDTVIVLDASRKLLRNLGCEARDRYPYLRELGAGFPDQVDAVARQDDLIESRYRQRRAAIYDAARAGLAAHSHQLYEKLSNNG